MGTSSERQAAGPTFVRRCPHAQALRGKGVVDSEDERVRVARLRMDDMLQDDPIGRMLRTGVHVTQRTRPSSRFCRVGSVSGRLEAPSGRTRSTPSWILFG